MDEARGKTLDILAIAALAALWAETVASLPGLPDVVPTSFGHDGMPHAYGSRFEFLLLPAIGTVMYAIVWLTLRTAYMKLNVPFTIPEDRLPLIRPIYDRTQRILRVVVLAGFVALQWAIIEGARNNELISSFGAIVSAVVIVVFVLVAWFIYRVWTIANSK
jgi:Protein of unknown function (DUF1648)